MTNEKLIWDLLTLTKISNFSPCTRTHWSLFQSNSRVEPTRFSCEHHNMSKTEAKTPIWDRERADRKWRNTAHWRNAHEERFHGRVDNFRVPVQDNFLTTSLRYTHNLNIICTPHTIIRHSFATNWDICIQENVQLNWKHSIKETHAPYIHLVNQVRGLWKNVSIPVKSPWCWCMKHGRCMSGFRLLGNRNTGSDGTRASTRGWGPSQLVVKGNSQSSHWVHALPDFLHSPLQLQWFFPTTLQFRPWQKAIHQWLD